MITRNIPVALRRFLVPARTEDKTGTLSAQQAAHRLHLPIDTVLALIESRLLLAWSDERQMRIPAEQILGPGQLVPGIERVVEVIPCSRVAWRFLVEDSPFLIGYPQRPLDRLITGQVNQVLRAAYAYNEAFT